MIEHDLMGRGVKNPSVLAAMRAVPREAFLEDAQQRDAYADNPLPIGDEQTISQPYIVALMAEALALQASDRVLEIGSGSGYATAVMARLTKQIFAVERNTRLAEISRTRFVAMHVDNVELRCGDGSLGWPERAPFDAITVAAAAPAVPKALLEQLAIGGRLVLPIGSDESNQQLLRVIRTDAETWQHQSLGAVRFVLLIGAQGWADPHRR